ncbi:MAG: hypothetical protein JW793_02650 [Acidobacteria bacterium]|nr:hypothetical protein [Acidobacteriota bacterium]
MTTIVVGGHSRNVGKTSIAAAIIAAWPEYSWTAVKLSSHWHDDNSGTALGGEEEICRVDEEFDRGSSRDTGRFLAAGASRSFWVRILPGRMREAMPRLLPVLNSNPFVVVESNGIVKHIKPSLFLMVHRYDVPEYKKSARETIGRAHAVVAVNYSGVTPAWNGISTETATDVPIFPVSDLHVLPQDLIEFIRIRLV